MTKQTNKASGDVFGPFQVQEQLGFGGMATVSRATKVSADGKTRSVALKRILPHLANDARIIANFKREARVGMLLNHRNIASVYDVGQVGDEHYISMEYINGWNLRQLRNDVDAVGRPSATVTLQILHDLSSALAYAHERRDELDAPLALVHRDISPANILLSRSGVVKIIDFGIAHVANNSSAEIHPLTKDGAFKGKLGYMAPEALTDGAVDARADLWSLGVLAHELVTGQSLFDDGSDFSTIERVRELEIPNPAAIVEGFPAPLGEIILRALERDVDRRWQSASAITEALEEFAIEFKLTRHSAAVATWCSRSTASAPVASHLAVPDLISELATTTTTTPLPLPPPPWLKSAAKPPPSPAPHLTFRDSTVSESASRAQPVLVPPAGLSYLHTRSPMAGSPGAKAAAASARRSSTTSGAAMQSSATSAADTPAFRTDLRGQADARDQSKSVSARRAPVTWPVGTQSPPIPPPRKEVSTSAQRPVLTPVPLPAPPRERPIVSSSALRDMALPRRRDRRLKWVIGIGVILISALLVIITKVTGTSETSQASSGQGSYIEIVTTPSDAQVFIEGKSQVLPLQLPAGSYDLEIRAQNFQTFRERLVVREGQDLKYRLILAP